MIAIAINLVAPINTLSYGVVSVNLLTAAERLGHHVSLWPIGPIEALPRYHETVKAALERAKLFTDAPSVRIFHQFSLDLYPGRGLRCGFPIFELTKFTAQEMHHLLAQDLVFTPSNWSKEVLLESGVPRERIRVARFGIDAEIFHDEAGTTEGPTLFLNCGKWEVRKGHDILVEAFNRAFTPKDDVRLEMLCGNPFIGKGNDEWASLYMNSPMGKAGKVAILPRLQTQEEVAAIMRRAHCGVFPSRAEGWNLELAEMMRLGKQVIATDYSAHGEYCTSNNSRLIHIDKLEAAYDGVFFDGHGEWAHLGEPQMEQLVHHLRAAHDKRESNQNGIETMKRFTWDRCAQELVAGLS